MSPDLDFNAEMVSMAFAWALRRRGVDATAVSTSLFIAHCPVRNGRAQALEACNTVDVAAVSLGGGVWMPEGTREWSQVPGVVATKIPGSRRGGHVTEISYRGAAAAIPTDPLNMMGRKTMGMDYDYLRQRVDESLGAGPCNNLAPRAPESMPQSDFAPQALLPWIASIDLARALGEPPPPGPELTALRPGKPGPVKVGAWARDGLSDGPLGPVALVIPHDPALQAVLRAELARRTNAPTCPQAPRSQRARM